MYSDNSSDSEKLVLVSDDDLLLEITAISELQSFTTEHTTALEDIVKIINQSIYKKLPLDIDRLLETKEKLEFSQVLNKKNLNTLPLLLQPLMLINGLSNDKTKEIAWLCVSIHTFLLLSYHKKAKTHQKNIISRFKLPVFSQSKNNRWIWSDLPELDTYDEPEKKSYNFLYLFFTKKFTILETEQKNREQLETQENEKTIKNRKRKINQLRTLSNCFEKAYYPHKKITRKRRKIVKNEYNDDLKNNSNKEPKQDELIKNDITVKMATKINDFYQGATWIQLEL